MTGYIGIIICSTLLGFCLSYIVLALWEKAKKQKETFNKTRIKHIQLKLDQALENDLNAARPVSFEKSLKNAALTTELQFTRLQNQHRATHSAPEKYTILNKLIGQGMGNQEIASILDISTTEVSQLANLRSITEQRT